MNIIPKCDYFNLCGGCTQQDIATQQQLLNKQEELLKLLGCLQPEYVAPPLTGPLWGYRTKARLGVRYVIKKEKVLIGFRESKARYIADMDSCEVLHPSIGKLIGKLKDFLHTLSCYQTIAQIEVAVGDDQLALIFRNMEPLTEMDTEQLISFAELHKFILYLQPGGLDTIHKIWPLVGAERLYYTLPQHDLRMSFHPIDFTQVNPVLNEKMIAQAIDWLDLNDQDHVLDLFCGLGNFTLPLAKEVANVVGVEGALAMVERGYENAQANNIKNVEFYATDLFKDISHLEWSKRAYTKVLLDPPRTGAQELLAYVAGLKVSTILYVSCNPATLARDAQILTNEFGYKLAKLGVMDMFPHTNHVESMALFTW